MALRNIGADFETYRVYEIDKYAIASYNAIHGTDFEPMDICEVHGEDMGIVDRDKYTYLLTYSFPCTDISHAGLMQGMAEDSNTRSSLLWQVKRILEELIEIDALPQVLVMENVTAIHNEENRPHYKRWLNFLESIGYSSYSEDLNAADFGVAQHRDRTFVVSILGEYNYKFPHGIELTTCIEDYFEDLTEEQALQYIVKSKKAHDLLVELDEKGQLD
jgi:DNA (cytosine-5)-methyltransferase 1